MPINESITTAPPVEGQPISYNKLPDGTEVAGQAAVMKEQTIGERVDQMNSPPPTAGDYQLPPIQFDGAPWEPSAEQLDAIDGLKNLAHRYGVPQVHFADLAEHAARGSLTNVEPEVLAAHLVNELGEAKAAECGALIYKVMMEDPQASAFLHAHQNLRVFMALYHSLTHRGVK